MGVLVREAVSKLGFSSRDYCEMLDNGEVRDWRGAAICEYNEEFDSNKPIFIKGVGYKVPGASFEKLHPDAKLPHKNNALDVGYDVCSIMETVMRPGEQCIVSTGLRLSFINDDIGIFVWPKSGLDAIFGLHTGAGVIDTGYRGEIKIVLKNQGDGTFTIRRGDEIAQLVFIPIARPIIGESVPAPSERGESGGINET